MNTTRARLPGIVIRDGMPSDADAVMRLLADGDPDDPTVFERARTYLSMPQEGPLSHFRALMVIAEDSEGRPLGALIAGSPLWLFEHPGIDDPVVMVCLADRIGTVKAVAVDPRQRGRGIGAKLIRHAVRRFTSAGYGLLTLNCSPALEGYYQGLGFSVMEDLNLALGPLNVVGQRWDDTRVAARALDQSVSLVTVKGLGSSVVSGLLPNSRLPRSAYFDGEQMRS
jgi:ribosomal protein S18 acetylase RimI-like enzyme